jgi:hypothetical protein
MTCSEFVSRFSEYYDGTVAEEYIGEAHAHLAGCPSCRRYRHVVERGAQLLQVLDTPAVRDDFRPRLQHRLYHVDQEAALRRHTTSGATALAVAGISVLLTAVAWSPTMRPSSPVVELAPIVVSRPPPRAVRPALSFPDRGVPRQFLDRSAGLWDDAHTLLFEYSRLSQQYERRSPLQRTRLDEDR